MANEFVKIKVDHTHFARYKRWCEKNATGVGGARKWSFKFTHYDSYGPGVSHVIFQDAEDALAFKLSFSITET